MTLYVQNDTGTTEYANSYVTVEEFQEYWTARGVDYTTTADATIEAYLIKGRFYLDNRFDYNGWRLNGRDQYTEFPRDELYDTRGESDVLVEGVPREFKDAQCEYAHIEATDGPLQPNQSTAGNIKRYREKTDVLEEETEYSPPGQTGGVISYPSADNCIPDCFIAYGSSGGQLIHT